MIFEKQILNVYKGMMHTRCDDNGTAFYFSAADFEGLIAEPLAFEATAGHTLQGYLYHYENVIPGRIIVFDHGFGGGHRAYMKEIEMLCRHGFLVFAYDHTGCMESGGKDPNGMAQSLRDLNDCLSTLKADPRFSSMDYSVVGHSWGGFSTMNIAAFHPEVSHIVVMSGFVSVEMLVSCFFGGLLKIYRKAIMKLERQANPKFVDSNGVDALSKVDVPVILTEEYAKAVGYATMEAIAQVAGLRRKANLYRVQVGAFLSRENAENMLKSIKNAGFEGLIVEVTKDGR